MVGKTHTGKSTLARQIATVLGNTQVLETDPITIFLKSNWPQLQEGEKMSPYSKVPVSPLRFRLFKEIFETAMRLNFNVILANANLQSFTRNELLKHARDYNYKVVIVFLNFTDDLILERVKHAKRNNDSLLVSNDFSEVLTKQSKIINIPQPDECDYLFEIKDPAEIPGLIEKIKNV